MAEKAKNVYFGVQARKKVDLGDGQYIEIKKLSEAEKDQHTNYVGSLAKDFNAETGEFTIDTGKIGEVNSSVMNLCISGFSVKFDNGSDQDASIITDKEKSWSELYKSLSVDKDLVPMLMKAIYELNPWLDRSTTTEKDSEKKS